MKKLLCALAAAAALAVTAGPAAAQYPAPGPYGPVAPATYGSGYGYGSPGCSPYDGGYGSGGYGFGGYGLGLGSKLKSGLFGFGLFGGLFTNYGGGGGGGGAGNNLPVVDPRSGNAGQLAYPHHPFYRSPRDYFMLEDR